jgi:hypothetical protein
MSYMPLLPFWILSAPLVLAVIDLLRTPRPVRRTDGPAHPAPTHVVPPAHA